MIARLPPPVIVLGTLAFLMVSCAGSIQQGADRGPIDSAAVSLKFETAAEGVPEWRPMAPGEAIRSGDRFELKVRVGQAAFLYVLERSGTAPATVLVPPDSNIPYQAQSDATAHLPVDGWFYLRGKAGQETLYLVASSKPLGLDQVEKEVERSSVENTRDRDPPPHSDNGNRDYDKIHHELRGRMDGRGIAVLRFPFVHIGT